eukprot:GGOE01021095.1.p1 GENE.GGOE01021095.1~~GGOE01021095.1.p1  ORF type:complete len:120 (-),score=22.96 GGOE01021095.1:97-456(-)
MGSSLLFQAPISGSPHCFTLMGDSSTAGCRMRPGFPRVALSPDGIQQEVPIPSNFGPNHLPKMKLKQFIQQEAESKVPNWVCPTCSATTPSVAWNIDAHRWPGARACAPPSPTPIEPSS